MSEPTHDRLLEHEYDGIREYDNPTPTWWHLIFLSTAVFSVLYLIFFHLGPLVGTNGWTLAQAYDASVAGTREDMSDLSDDLAANLMAAGAYFSRPYGPWAQPVYNRDAAARDALRKIKAIFDPAGIMNPGKLCFGAPVAPRALAEKEA